VVADIKVVNSDVKDVKLGHYFVNRHDVRARDFGGQTRIAILAPAEGQFDLCGALWIAPANEPRCSRSAIVTMKIGGDMGNLGLIAKRRQKVCRVTYWRPGKPLRHVVEMSSR
jgi:hypothetical protein